METTILIWGVHLECLSVGKEQNFRESCRLARRSKGKVRTSFAAAARSNELGSLVVLVHILLLYDPKLLRQYFFGHRV